MFKTTGTETRRRIPAGILLLVALATTGCGHFGGWGCGRWGQGCDSCRQPGACDPCRQPTACQQGGCRLRGWCGRGCGQPCGNDCQSCEPCDPCCSWRARLCGCCFGWLHCRSNAIPDTLPLGSTVRAHYQTMETNAEAADFIFHRHDFVGKTVQLTPDARDKIPEVAARMRTQAVSRADRKKREQLRPRLGPTPEELCRSDTDRSGGA